MQQQRQQQPASFFFFIPSQLLPPSHPAATKEVATNAQAQQQQMRQAAQSSSETQLDSTQHNTHKWYWSVYYYCSTNFLPFPPFLPFASKLSSLQSCNNFRCTGRHTNTHHHEQLSSSAGQGQEEALILDSEPLTSSGRPKSCSFDDIGAQWCSEACELMG